MPCMTTLPHFFLCGRQWLLCRRDVDVVLVSLAKADRMRNHRMGQAWASRGLNCPSSRFGRRLRLGASMLRGWYDGGEDKMGERPFSETLHFWVGYGPFVIAPKNIHTCTSANHFSTLPEQPLRNTRRSNKLYGRHYLRAPSFRESGASSTRPSGQRKSSICVLVIYLNVHT